MLKLFGGAFPEVMLFAQGVITDDTSHMTDVSFLAL